MSADDPAVRFVGGSTGPEVRVCTTGAAETNARIDLQFGDALSAQPSFGVKVVEPKVVTILEVPLVKVQGGMERHLDSQAVKRAELIFEQVGVQLNISQYGKSVEFIGVDGIMAENEGTWSGLRGLLPEWKKLMVFVVPMINGSALAFSCGTGAREIVTDSNCVGDLLAHEIGHALGLEDVYADSWDSSFGKRSLRRVIADGTISSRHFSDSNDWNGGSGERYYPYDAMRAYLMPRFLMCGASTSSGSIDLPLDKVKGVGALTSNAADFKDEMCPIGYADLSDGHWLREEDNE